MVDAHKARDGDVGSRVLVYDGIGPRGGTLPRRVMVSNPIYFDRKTRGKNKAGKEARRGGQGGRMKEVSRVATTTVVVVVVVVGANAFGLCKSSLNRSSN
jgi:hypothetical protein